MRRLYLLLLVLILCPYIAKAQNGYVTVTGIIKDPTGALYVNSQVGASFIDPGTSGKLPLLYGSTFQQSYTGYGTDSFAHFSMSVADTQQIGSSSGATGTSWRFTILYQDRATSFTYQTPIDCVDNIPVTCTGGVMDISAPLQAAAALLPTSGGNGSFSSITPLFSSTPTFSSNSNATFNYTLTNNVTTSNFVSHPPFGLATIFQFNICENSVGGFNMVWPSNVVLPPNYTFNTSPNACSPVAFVYSPLSNMWTPWQTMNASGGGGGNPSVGSQFTGQIVGSIPGTFAPGNFSDNGIDFFLNDNFHPKGLNPYTDPTNFGARALPSNANVQGTASCNGTSTITTTSILALNNGDGIMVRGCGPAPTVSTPPAPVIATGNTEVEDSPVPSLSNATGSGTYSALLVFRDSLGGLSLPGPATQITNSVTLGHQTATASSAVLTNNFLVITFTSTPSDLAVGAMVHYQQSSNAQLSTMGNVTGVTGTTVSMTVSNYCNPACTSTGGTITYSNVNKITFTNNSGTNLYEAYICIKRPGDSSYHIDGATMPNITNMVASLTNTFADYGATITGTTSVGYPTYVTDAICTAGSVTNEMYSGTIVLGAGTLNLVMNNSASQTASGQFITQDDYPALVLADASAANGAPANTPGILDLPFTPISKGVYNTWLPITFTSRPRIRGTLFAHEPITLSAGLEGVTLGSTQGQFAIDGYSTIASQGAFPLLIRNGNAASIEKVQLSVSGNYVGILTTGTNGGINKVGCYSGGNEYSGQCIVYSGTPFQETLSDFTATVGPNQVDNSSWVPTIYGIQSSNQNGVMYLKGALRFQPRGFFFDNTGSPFGMTIDASQMQFYGQGNIMPVIAEAGTTHPGLLVGCGIEPRDTSIEPLTAIWEILGPSQPSTDFYACGLVPTGQETGGFPPSYTGAVSGIPNVNMFPFLLNSATIPPFMLAPGTTGKAANGQDWASVYSLVPTSNVPTAFAGTNLFHLSTDNWPSFNVNGSVARYLFASLPSTTSWVASQCLQSTATVNIYTLGTCGGGGFTNPMTTLGDMIVENATPTAVRLPGPTAVSGVPYTLTNTPVAGAASLENWGLAGVPVNNNGETTCASYTLNVLDRATNIRCSTGTTATITFPVHTTTGFNFNYPVDIFNLNSGNLTLTVTSPDTIDGGSAGGSQTVLPSWEAALRQDSNGNWYTTRRPTYAAFGSTCGDATHALAWSTSTGFSCQSLSTTAITVQTNGTNNISQTTLNFVNPSNFNGLTFTFSNPSSGNETFAVGGTLANGGLANSTIPINGTTCTLGSACSPPPNNSGFTDTTNSTSIAQVIIGTAPAVGQYLLTYYADLNSTCPTGSDTWSFLFQWVDGSATRTLQTGSLTAGTSQLTSSYLEGTFSIWVGSGNVTVTPQLNGSCASGNSSYDLHTTLTGKLR